jgi:prevent-host-death family protein
MTVGVRELKNKLTQYLRRTKQGEEVVVTERGRPIAVIQPIQSVQGPASLEARLARAAAQGRLSLPTGRPRGDRRRVRVRGVPVSRTILADRR